MLPISFIFFIIVIVILIIILYFNVSIYYQQQNYQKNINIMLKTINTCVLNDTLNDTSYKNRKH